MSDKIEDTKPQTEDEAYRQELLGRAQLMGLTIHPKAKPETIQAKIQAALDEGAEKEAAPVQKPAAKAVHPAMRLHRVIITCNDPQKADQSGDIISVSNAEVGSIRFYFHFNKPWHVPEIVLNTIREAKLFLHSSRNNGRDVVTREVPRYNVEVLPPLTEEGLKRIADKQAAALATED